MPSRVTRRHAVVSMIAGSVGWAVAPATDAGSMSVRSAPAALGAAERAQLVDAARLAAALQDPPPHCLPVYEIANYVADHVDEGLGGQLDHYHELADQAQLARGAVLGYALAVTRDGDRASWPLRAIAATGLPMSETAREGVVRYTADPARIRADHAAAADFDADRRAAAGSADPLAGRLQAVMTSVRRAPGWPNAGRPWGLLREVDAQAAAAGLTALERARIRVALLGAAAADAELIEAAV